MKDPTYDKSQPKHSAAVYRVARVLLDTSVPDPDEWHVATTKARAAIAEVFALLDEPSDEYLKNGGDGEMWRAGIRERRRELLPPATEQNGEAT